VDVSATAQNEAIRKVGETVAVVIDTVADLARVGMHASGVIVAVLTGALGARHRAEAISVTVDSRDRTRLLLLDALDDAMLADCETGRLLRHTAPIDTRFDAGAIESVRAVRVLFALRLGLTADPAHSSFARRTRRTFARGAFTRRTFARRTFARRTFARRTFARRARPGHAFAGSACV
jgi:hypothetical protein